MHSDAFVHAQTLLSTLFGYIMGWRRRFAPALDDMEKRLRIKVLERYLIVQIRFRNAFSGTAARPRAFVPYPVRESASMTNVAKPHIPPLKLRRTPFTAKRRAGRAYPATFGRLRKAIGDLFRRPTPRA
jgi:hypothetical protein